MTAEDDRRAGPPGVAAADGYAGYVEWKGWTGRFAADTRNARYFAAEFRGIELAGKRLLEIGFGDGGFLAWARAAGAEVRGIELDAGLCIAGRRAGFDVTAATLAELAAGGTAFDVIVALDVLEHWDHSELVANLRHIQTLLRDGGLFLARFPNGQSPYGRIYQHGDFSHRTTLSTYRIEYLAQLTGLDVVRIDNACRVSSHTGVLPALRQHWLAWRRRRIERHIARLYGIRRLPLDPNLVAVLRKPRAAT